MGRVGWAALIITIASAIFIPAVWSLVGDMPTWALIDIIIISGAVCIDCLMVIIWGGPDAKQVETKTEPEPVPVMRIGSHQGVRPLSPDDKHPLKLEVRSDPAYMPAMTTEGDLYWIISGVRITNREKKPVILHFSFCMPWVRDGLDIPSEPMEFCSPAIHPLAIDRARHWNHSVRIEAEGSAAGHLDFFYPKSLVDSLRAAEPERSTALVLPDKKFLVIQDDLSGKACAHDMTFQRAPEVE
jgi:hypothetical protein